MATPVALLKFTQGSLAGDPGEALKGVPGVPVEVRNGNNAHVQSWRINLVYVPPGSSVPVAIPLAQNSASSVPYAVFTPDAVPGPYRFQLIVYSGVGFSGTYQQDIRNFIVPDPRYGIVFPPYQMLPPKLPLEGTGFENEKPDELNVENQPFGWDGMGTDGLVLDFMRRTVSGVFGGFVYKRIVSGQSWYIPENTQALLDGRVVNDGRVVLDGYMRILARQRPPKIMPVVSQDADVPNNCIQPINPLPGRPFTLRLRRRGAPGDPVIIVSHSDDPTPATVTVDGQGPLIGGQSTRVINTPRETLVLTRRRGHDWEVL